MIKEAIKKVVGKEDLTYDEAYTVMNEIMSGESSAVENAAYPVGICAERAAIAAAVTSGERAFEALAVIADSPEACAPCGMCRQVMAEFPIRRVILANLRGNMHVLSPAELLPHAFGAAALPAKEESPT